MNEASQIVPAAAIHSNYKCGVDFSWPVLLAKLFPEKTPAYVATFTRTSVAAVAHIMRGRNGLSGGALVNLLRSAIGPRILDAIAGDTEWRANEKRLMRIADLELQLEEQKRRLGSLRRQVGE